MTLSQKIFLIALICVLIVGVIYYSMSKQSSAMSKQSSAMSKQSSAMSTLYAVDTPNPWQTKLSWDETSGKGIRVYTEWVPDSTQFNVCKSADTPVKYMIPPNGDPCPSGWSIGPQFYAYKNQQPNTIPVCIGYAENPLRGNIRINETNCGVDGWNQSGI